MRSCLPRARVVRVTGYSVQDASHDTARDGSVTVHLNVPDEDARLEILWSNGVVSTARVLPNVRPGVYGAIVLTRNDARVRSVHACEPARVGSGGGDGALRSAATSSSR